MTKKEIFDKIVQVSAEVCCVSQDDIMNGSRKEDVVTARACAVFWASAAEFFNSITHELAHLACHIASQDGLDLESEDLCYIEGDAAAQIYPFVEELLCSHCRERQKRNFYK